LQKTRSEKFALKLDSSLDESPRGDWLSICPLRRRPDGLEFEVQGIMLKVAPVSTKNLSLVNSSVRKGSPALAGICIAVTVACAGMQCCGAETFCFRSGSDFQKVLAPARAPATAPTLAFYLPFITNFIFKSGFFMFFYERIST
jgi:hypothetical protein